MRFYSNRVVLFWNILPILNVVIACQSRNYTTNALFRYHCLHQLIKMMKSAKYICFFRLTKITLIMMVFCYICIINEMLSGSNCKIPPFSKKIILSTTLYMIYHAYTIQNNIHIWKKRRRKKKHREREKCEDKIKHTFYILFIRLDNILI